MAAKLERFELGKLSISERAQVNALFMSIGEGVIVTDTEARISRVNKATVDILGFSEKELLGKWMPDIIVAEDQNGNVLSSLERPIGQAFLRGESVTARAYYRRKNGTTVPVNLTVAPVLLNGKPTGAIEVFRDISREVALEEAKDEFVAITSHQLRTPATAVKQYIGLLLEGYADPLTDSQRVFLERAYESNERQLHIVDEILKVTQIDLEKIILKPTPVDLRKVARDAVATLTSKFEAKNQKIVIEEPEHEIPANIDRDQIRVAIENLLENASNYTWADKEIKVVTKSRKNRVYVSVIDQGVGIDPADFSKLFQKFSRIPNELSVETGGTGLGLYWAYQIARLHEGYISVKSTPGKGTNFTINLPSNL
ncbi:MAG TPA: ATP-binding protein [Candidatus Saccharimonadales bacterium]|nr:ATP-binding protein [Candidatus Saccharimonadales bacterium]